jgi:hypothetical protein
MTKEESVVVLSAAEISVDEAEKQNSTSSCRKRGRNDDEEEDTAHSTIQSEQEIPDEDDDEGSSEEDEDEGSSEEDEDEDSSEEDEEDDDDDDQREYHLHRKCFTAFLLPNKGAPTLGFGRLHRSKDGGKSFLLKQLMVATNPEALLTTFYRSYYFPPTSCVPILTEFLMADNLHFQLSE